MHGIKIRLSTMKNNGRWRKRNRKFTKPEAERNKMRPPQPKYTTPDHEDSPDEKCKPSAWGNLRCNYIVHYNCCHRVPFILWRYPHRRYLPLISFGTSIVNKYWLLSLSSFLYILIFFGSCLGFSRSSLRNQFFLAPKAWSAFCNGTVNLLAIARIFINSLGTSQDRSVQTKTYRIRP